MSHDLQFKHWDQALKAFLIDMQLTQALRGFENDMLVLNLDWETKTAPLAMAKFIRTLVAMNTTTSDNTGDEKMMDIDSDMDERKLAYVHPSNSEKPQTPTQINKSISQFIARNRARNDVSNRSEFLHHLDNIRASQSDVVDTSSWASCARVDMKTIEREKQMKYDIAKNEDGPLKRTMKGVNGDSNTTTTPSMAQGEGRKQPSAVPGSVSHGVTDEDVGMALTAGRYPGLEERIGNIEKHIAIRYVPSPPKSLLDRLKLLEDHLVRLEKDYPPSWAALHFNQPRRSWPPPPRSIPIIVPPHMRAGSSSALTTTTQTPIGTGVVSGDSSTMTEGVTTITPSGGGRMKHSTSSLQKAVLEKLEVMQAMNDLAGPAGGNV